MLLVWPQEIVKELNIHVWTEIKWMLSVQRVYLKLCAWLTLQGSEC